MVKNSEGIYKFVERVDGPEGFPFAICRDDKVMLWAQDRKLAEHLCWCLSYGEALKDVKNKEFIHLLTDYLERFQC